MDKQKQTETCMDCDSENIKIINERTHIDTNFGTDFEIECEDCGLHYGIHKNGKLVSHYLFD